MSANVNYTNKRAFLYGFAMHILSDSYAHSAYKSLDGKWQTLHHKYTDKGLSESKKQKAAKRYADDPTIAKYRYDISYAAVSNTWNRLFSNEKNYKIYKDYYHSNYDSYYLANLSNEKSFKLHKIYRYAIECGISSVYDSQALNAFSRINFE